MPGNEPVFPIGLSCIQNALQRQDHATEIFDFVANSKLVEDLAWVRKDWDIIAFSIRDIDPIDLARDGHVAHYRAFVERVQAQATGRPIFVGGGPGYSLFADELLAELRLDVGVRGPGERQMSRIAQDPERWRQYGGNLEGMRDPEFVSTPIRHADGLMQAYSSVAEPSIGIETRRKTCYQKCVYCPYAHINGDNDGDLKPLELIAHEIQSIYDAGLRRIFFTDAIFNSELSFAKKIVRLLADLSLPDLKWSAYFAPKPFDDEFAELLSLSGVDQVIISPDSLDPAMMKVLGKRFDRRHVTRTLERCRRHSINLKVIIVMGGPGESQASVRSSAEYANEHLRADELLIFVGFRVLPGTELGNLVALPSAQILQPTFYPFDPDIFSWVLDAFDRRFFTTGRLLHLFAGRHASQRMAEVPGGSVIDTSQSRRSLPLTVLRRTGLNETASHSPERAL